MNEIDSTSNEGATVCKKLENVIFVTRNAQQKTVLMPKGLKLVESTKKHFTFFNLKKDEKIVEY